MFFHHCLKKLTLVCLICFCWPGQGFTQETTSESETADVTKVTTKKENQNVIVFTVPKYRRPSLKIMEAVVAENHYYLDGDTIFKEMKKEEYDKVVALLETDIQKKVGPIDSLWTKSSDTLWYYAGGYLGRDLALLAEIFEYRGKYSESKNLYDVRSKARGDDDNYHWRAARINYAQKNYKETFLKICEAVEDDYTFWNLDSTPARRNEAGNTYRWNGPEHHLWNSERDSVYCLKDKCVRVICPNYHWKYNDRYHVEKESGKWLALYVDFFQEFMELVEREYSNLTSSEIPDAQKKDNENFYGPIVEQFRKLAQLP